VSITNYRLVVGFSILWLVFSVVMLLLYPAEYPHELYEFTSEQDSAFSDPVEVVASLAAFAAIIGNIGLLFLHRWARAVYAVCIPLSILVTTFDGGVTIETGFETFLYDVDLFLSGIIITLSYFSSARHHFEPDLAR